jgi:MFS family permease
MEEKFKFKNLLDLKENRFLFRYVFIIFILYLVVSQFMAPFSLYTVDFMRISKTQLGLLYGLNGLIVILFQIPTTSLLRKYRLTRQLILGTLLYAVGYFWCGMSSAIWGFVLVIIIITLGENCISPPSLSITANLAPPDQRGRYMGIFGLAVTLGWSLGPLLGGILLDILKPQFTISWTLVAVLALLAAAGFYRLERLLPIQINRKLD